MKQPLRPDCAGRAARRLRACLGFVLASSVCPVQSPAGSYEVDGRANVIGADLEAKAVLVQLSGPRTYVFRLAASDFKENRNTAPQRHVVVSMDSSAGDLRTFTLNGEGDMQVVSTAADLSAKVVFVDREPGDNAGSSTVQVLHGDTIVAEATADGVANVIGANVDEKSVLAPLPEPGTYVFRLTASDFKENWNTAPQRHGVISMDSSAGDNRTVTLNGLDDARAIEIAAASTAKMFFIDTMADDNAGQSRIEVERATLVAEFTVDGKANVIGADLVTKAALIRLPGPRTYVFRLTSCDFRENWNTSPQRQVVISMDSSAGDYRTFTLNGVGNAKVVQTTAPLTAKAFFIDTETDDNTGSATVQVLSVGRGLPNVSVALHAGVTIRGTVGRSYTIQSATSLNPPNWEALATITLSAPMQVWFDPEPAEYPLRAYRAVEP